MDKLTSFLKVASLLVTAVGTIERIFRTDPAASPGENNRARQDAAVEMVADVAPLVQTLIPKAVIHVPAVQAALRQAIDAIVALHNAIRAALDAIGTASSTSADGGTT